MLLNPPRQRHLLPHLRARRRRQLQLRSIRLHRHNLRARRRRPNIHHQHLVLRQFSDLRLFAIRSLHTEESSQQEVVNLQLGEDLRQTTLQPQHESNKTIGTAEGRVDAGADADEAAWDGEFEAVVLGEEGDDAGVDGAALDLAVFVFADDARADFDLVAEFQDSRKDGAACDAALELFDFGARLVDVEGADDDELGCVLEVAGGDGYAAAEHFVDGIDVEFQLGGDRDDGAIIGHGSADELLDAVVVLGCRFFSHQVDFVLQDDDVGEFHNFDGGQVLGGLGLGAGFVAGDEEEGGVHDCGAGQHGAHEDIMARAVDEAVYIC